MATGNGHCHSKKTSAEKKVKTAAEKKKEGKQEPPKGDTLPTLWYMYGMCVALTYKSKWTANALKSDGQVLSKAAQARFKLQEHFKLGMAQFLLRFFQRVKHKS